MDNIEFRITEFLKKSSFSFEKRALVDFDGPIHSYSKGWKDGVPYDDPAPGVKEALTELKRRGYKIYIHSARFSPDITLYGKNHTDPEQVYLVKQYLDKHEIPYDGFLPKAYGDVYIDDRGIKCDPINDSTSSWEKILDKIT